MEAIETIRLKAEAHKQRFKSFNLDTFLRWVERQSRQWQEWAANESIPRINHQRHAMTWDTIQTAGRIKYTPECPLD